MNLTCSVFTYTLITVIMRVLPCTCSDAFQCLSFSDVVKQRATGSEYALHREEDQGQEAVKRKVISDQAESLPIGEAPASKEIPAAIETA